MPGVERGPAVHHNGSFEGSSSGFPSRHQQQQNQSNYYYARNQNQGISPGSSTGGSKMPRSPYGNGVSTGDRRTKQLGEDETPSYWVEHLATFAVGKQYGLEWPADGIRKLKQMERNSAIWAQPMVLRLRPNQVSVEDENGELVEQFPMELVCDPTAHLSTDPRDAYNNIVLFVVKEDRRTGVRQTTPTEMHIFQCNRVSANDVVDDLRNFIQGQFSRVRPGRRDTGFVVGNTPILVNGSSQPVNQYTRTESREVRGDERRDARRTGVGGGAVEVERFVRDDASASSDSSETFERDVNTLNRCFDDIERFVARIQSAALAQRELEAQQNRRRRSRNQDQGILALRAQLPAEMEFVDILQKFKLSFNLLSKLKNHIHEPNAPELLHFLFTPLTVILDACQWGLGRIIAPQVVSPLLARETKELMENCLTSKEHDVWMALGDAWRITPEEWPGPLPQPYRPVFGDGFMPYGAPGGIHTEQRAVRGPISAPVNHHHSQTRIDRRSVDNLSEDVDRMTLERDKLYHEKDKLAERERRLWDEERKMGEERLRLEMERRHLIDEQERRSVSSERPAHTYFAHQHQYRDSTRSSPVPMRRAHSTQLPVPSGVSVDSPRQRAFVDDLLARRAKVVQCTYDRVGTNAKELTVSRGEYLEVMSDVKNWWECRNIHSRIGYVPHTILSVVTSADLASPPAPQDPIFVNPPGPSSSGPPSAIPERPLPSGVSPAGRQEYVEVVSAGVQANLSNYNQQQLSYQTVTQPSQPYVPPPPAPGPPPADLNSVKLRHRQTNGYADPAVRNSAELKQARARLDVLRREKSNPELLRDELHETLSRKQKHEILRNRHSGEQSLILTERSVEPAVSEWLQSKGLSMRTLQILEGQTGATLFALSKRQLQDFCGRDEGQRLYSQLLVQKNLSGYSTKSGAELNAILKLRKQKSDKKGAVQEQKGEELGITLATYSQLEQLFEHNDGHTPQTSSPRN